MSAITKCTIAVFLSLALGTVATAQSRSWTKSHETLEMDQETYAEYTNIATSDGLSPREARILFKDSMTGALLVIRKSTAYDQDGNGKPTALLSTETRITSPDNADSVVILTNGDGMISVAFGQASLSFVDQLPIAQSTKDQAIGLLNANTSTAFRQALQGLAKVGSYYWPRMQASGNLLRKLLFPTLLDQQSTNLISEPEAVVKHFDPAQVPPGEFELQFGQAYFE